MTRLVIRLIENELKANKCEQQGHRYSEKLKDFAVTMHFYSAQAHNYVRKFLNLPHPCTLRKWASSRNCQPGFLSEVVATLKRSITPNLTDIVLMFDAMAIKKPINMTQALKPTVDLSTMDIFSVDVKRLWPQEYWCS